MRVFVTGATGFVGSAVVRELIAGGHRVSGLARSDRAAAALTAARAEVVPGDLADPEGLAAAAAAADATIHTAFIHDFANFPASVEADQRAIAAIGGALKGSGRPFLVTSAIGLLPQGTLATETTAVATQGHAALRGRSETLALSFLPLGVAVQIVRLPPSVHGAGDHGFVPMLIDLARRRGLSGFVGAGDNRWPAVHRDDAARAYVLALESGGVGSAVHAVGETGVPFRALAEAIGAGLGLPAGSVPESGAAEHFGWMAGFARMDLPASSALTRERLGWTPTGPGLLADLEQGGYFAD